MIDKFKLSEKSKSQLVTIKRRTKVQNWNVLCRWALCLSLSEPSEPPAERTPQDSNVEMTWRTFGGQHEGLYWALIADRFNTQGQNSGLPIEQYFLLHLTRGISYLNQRTANGNIASLLELVA